jgi:hypothetical protein
LSGRKSSIEMTTENSCVSVFTLKGVRHEMYLFQLSSVLGIGLCGRKHAGWDEGIDKVQSVSSKAESWPDTKAVEGNVAWTP